MNTKPLLLVLGSCLVFGVGFLIQPGLVAQTETPVTPPAAPATPVPAAPVPATGTNPAEAAAIATLITQLQQQQTQMAANQTAIEQKLAELAENVRQARIFARRGGGGGGE